MSMSIHDEAVSAALKATNEGGFQHITGVSVVVILEAAAPYLLAQAWNEGAIAGWKQSGEGWNNEYPDESTGECSVDLTANPYRSEANYGCPDCGASDWACDCRWRNAE